MARYSKGARKKQVLSDEEILRLSEIILKIENHYGFPCDIEWAFENGRFYIVQSRPITTLQNNHSQISVEGPVIPSNVLKKIWSKRHSLRLGENWSFGPLQFEELFGVKFPNQFIGYKDGFGTGYVDDEMLQSCYKHVIAEIYKLGFEEYFEKRALSVFNNFFDYSKQIHKSISGLASNIEIHKLWDEFVRSEDLWMNYVWMVFLLDDGLTNEIKRRLADINFNDIDRLLPAMVAPELKTAAYKLKKELLELSVREKGGKDINVDLQELTDRYSYFSILNMNENPLEISYFRNEIDKLKDKDSPSDLGTLDQDEIEMSKLYEEVKIKLSPHPDILRLINACKKVAYYREYRNDLRQESYFYARHLYIEISKRAGINMENLIFATRKEIAGFLLNREKINGNILLERKALSAITSDYENSSVNYIFDKEKVLEMWPQENVDKNIKEFKGIVAFKGKITGKVKVIFDVTKQSDNFKEGDILMATTTNLSFIPLMSKAVAIVTDEGGLLTHTAIVARELKKIAIVGSKVATKVLKDGDMIEVDAIAGVVRILK